VPRLKTKQQHLADRKGLSLHAPINQHVRFEDNRNRRIVLSFRNFEFELEDFELIYRCEIDGIFLFHSLATINRPVNALVDQSQSVASALYYGVGTRDCFVLWIIPDAHRIVIPTTDAYRHLVAARQYLLTPSAHRDVDEIVHVRSTRTGP
jgi:hypothetical protein